MSAPSISKLIVCINPLQCDGCAGKAKPLCVEACEKEHGGKSFIRLLKLDESKIYVPLMCRHCSKAPCVMVCPEEAAAYDDDGAVIIDPNKCRACRMCAIVCPFGIPEFDPSLNAMMKCDLCAERRKKGAVPACVEACPRGALSYAPSLMDAVSNIESPFPSFFTVSSHVPGGE